MGRLANLGKRQEINHREKRAQCQDWSGRRHILRWMEADIENKKSDHSRPWGSRMSWQVDLWLYSESKLGHWQSADCRQKVSLLSGELIWSIQSRINKAKMFLGWAMGYYLWHWWRDSFWAIYQPQVGNTNACRNASKWVYGHERELQVYVSKWLGLYRWAQRRWKT